MAEKRQQLPHLVLPSPATTEEYKPRAAFPKLRIPDRNVGRHGKHLLQQFEEVTKTSTELEAARQKLGIGIKSGIQIEFESQEDSDLKIESLESRDAGIELRNVRRIGNRTFATVHVPDGQLAYFIKRVEEYLTKKTSGEKPQPKNRALIAGIENVRVAALDALWTDDLALLPKGDEVVWWEVWLSNGPTAGDPEEVIRQAAQVFNLEISAEKLEFPEHIVLALRATKKQLSQSLAVVNVDFHPKLSHFWG